MAGTVFEIYRRQVLGGGIEMKQKIAGRTVSLKFNLDFGPGGRVEFMGVEACLLADRFAQLKLPHGERRNLWQSFPGLPARHEIALRLGLDVIKLPNLQQMNLETRHAPLILRILEKERDIGMRYVVFEMLPMDMQLQPHQLDFFRTQEEALDCWDAKAGYGYLPGGEERPVYYRTVEQFLLEMRQANPVMQPEDLKLTPPVHAQAAIDNLLNSKNMNLNNLEDIRKEVNGLGFNPRIAEELEPHMRNQTPYFTLKDEHPGDHGVQVEMTLHFRKSNESQSYSFNKFEAAASKVPPAPDNQLYMVLTENKEKPERPLVREFESGNEAVEFFKKQKGTSELALGESPESKQLLASKEEGTVTYINSDFRPFYADAAIKQTFYLRDYGEFNARQAVNLVQRRTVHQDNMLNYKTGQTYKAWVGLDFDQKKDDYGNYKFKQMNDPNFGFDLEKTLARYNIKELADPAKKEDMIEAIKQGDRLDVTVKGVDNKEHKVQMEVVPRYKTVDFYNAQGEKMKREPFQKTDLNKGFDKDKGKGKGKDEGEDLGVAV